MKNCPCCGKELTNGRIYTGQRIRWTTEKEFLSGVLNKNAGEFWLKSENTLAQGLWKGFPCAGYYCPDCELILLPQREEKSS